jgi:elongation factor Ts
MSGVKITAAMVSELRKQTDAPMMKCKQALEAVGGDMAAAVEELRKSGVASAQKRSSRIAAEGVALVGVTPDGEFGTLIEVNCETDFVAKEPQFVQFCDALLATALNSRITLVEDLLAASSESGKTFEEWRCELVAKIGENIQVRRIAAISSDSGLVASYLHGVRIGVLVGISTKNEDLGRDIAMHVAATNPQAIDESGISSEVISKEKEIYTEQAQQTGKPADIIEKMVAGRISKFMKDNTLLGQPFVKNPDITVAALLKQHASKVLDMVRFEVGEGIEKEEKDFAAEVMEQLKK